MLPLVITTRTGSRPLFLFLGSGFPDYRVKIRKGTYPFIPRLLLGLNNWGFGGFDTCVQVASDAVSPTPAFCDAGPGRKSLASLGFRV